MAEKLPEVGKTYEAPYPFVAEGWTDWNGGNPESFESWKPGFDVNQDGTRRSLCADEMGKVSLRVVSLHKPGPKYPTRVFYVRQWQDPDGKVFGKTSLKVISARSFWKRLQPDWMCEVHIEGLGLNEPLQGAGQ